MRMSSRWILRLLFIYLLLLLLFSDFCEIFLFFYLFEAKAVMGEKERGSSSVSTCLRLHSAKVKHNRAPG